MHVSIALHNIAKLVPMAIWRVGVGYNVVCCSVILEAVFVRPHILTLIFVAFGLRW